VPQVQTGIHSGQAERLTDTLIPLPLTWPPIHPKIAARGRSASLIDRIDPSIFRYRPEEVVDGARSQSSKVFDV
jgi:hypothetical protein